MHGFAPGAAEERRQETRIRLAQVIDDGELVGLVDLRDEIPSVAPDLVVGRIVDGVGRPHDVVAVERHAVGPLHALAQVPGDRQAVFADAAVRLRRDLGRELRNGPVVDVVPHEIRHRQLGEVAERRGGREVRVQRRDVLRVADAQRVRDGVAVVRTARRAALARGRRHLARLRACREQHARGDDRQSFLHRYAPQMSASTRSSNAVTWLGRNPWRSSLYANTSSRASSTIVGTSRSSRSCTKRSAAR